MILGFLSSCMLIFFVCVALARSSVYAMLSFISFMCCVSLVMIAVSFEYLGILFLITYVGATSLFFLSIILMLDLSKESLSARNKVRDFAMFLLIFCIVYIGYVISFQNFKLLELINTPDTFSLIIATFSSIFFSLLFSLSLFYTLSKRMNARSSIFRDFISVFVLSIFFFFSTGSVFNISVDKKDDLYIPSIEDIAHVLYSDYIFVFQCVGILLLFAAIASCMLLIELFSQRSLNIRKVPLLEVMMRDKSSIYFLRKDEKSEKDG